LLRAICAEALRGRGLIAFHDYSLVSGAIRAFVREAWSDVSLAVAFTGSTSSSVFAVELGGAGILRSPFVERAINSTWHRLVWRTTSRWERSATPLLLAWSAMPAFDVGIVELNSACVTRSHEELPTRPPIVEPGRRLPSSFRRTLRGRILNEVQRLNSEWLVAR
jgi:hypothetical protein